MRQICHELTRCTQKQKCINYGLKNPRYPNQATNCTPGGGKSDTWKEAMKINCEKQAYTDIHYFYSVTRLGLQCRTPLRSNPLTLIP